MKVTTTATLPQETRDAGFFLPADIPGGPVFAFGGNIGKVDFSKISPTTAANLLAHGVTCIARKASAEAQKAADTGKNPKG